MAVLIPNPRVLDKKAMHPLKLEVSFNNDEHKRSVKEKKRILFKLIFGAELR